MVRARTMDLVLSVCILSLLEHLPAHLGVNRGELWHWQKRQHLDKEYRDCWKSRIHGLAVKGKASGIVNQGCQLFIDKDHSVCAT
jgi:hypothetical protein